MLDQITKIKEVWINVSLDPNKKILISNYGRMCSLKSKGWYYYTPNKDWCISTYRAQYENWGLTGPRTSSMRQLVLHFFGKPGIKWTDKNLDKLTEDNFNRNLRNGTCCYYKQIRGTGRQPHYRASKEKTIDPKLLRKCVTCREITTQWRCPACWKEINERNEIEEDMGHPDDEYKIL